MTRSAHAAALRSTALIDSPGAGRPRAGIPALATATPRPTRKFRAEAAADRAAASVPKYGELPTQEYREPAARRATTAAAPRIEPAPRQHAPRAPLAARRRRASRCRRQPSPRRRRRRRPTRTRCENVIELVRKHKPDDATAGGGGDLAIRWRASSPNGSSCAATTTARRVERYRAFIVGQSELAVADLPAPAAGGRAVGRPSRRHHGAVAGSRTNRRCRPRAARAGARPARRAATAPMPSAWCATPGATTRCRRTPRTRRSTMFGALLTPGDQKARMDLLLYGSEHEAAAARRQAARQRRCRARQGADRLLSQGANSKRAARGGAARAAWRPRLHLQQDPAAAPRGEIRRGRPADAERAEGSRPPVQSR